MFGSWLSHQLVTAPDGRPPASSRVPWSHKGPAIAGRDRAVPPRPRQLGTTAFGPRLAYV